MSIGLMSHFGNFFVKKRPVMMGLLRKLSIITHVIRKEFYLFVTVSVSGIILLTSYNKWLFVVL